MTASRIVISMDAHLLRRVDIHVKQKQFRSRSHAIQTAVAEKLCSLSQDDFTRESANLDPKAEKAWAECGLAQDFKSWPRY
jgi:Arc/MetJ-type ribon-helix-helix transcriptional regulator